MEIQVDPALLVVNLENCINSEDTQQIVKGGCMYAVTVAANDDSTMVQIPVSVHCTGDVQQAYGAIPQLQHQSSTSSHQQYNQVQPQQYTRIQMSEDLQCLVGANSQVLNEEASREVTEILSDLVPEHQTSLDVNTLYYNDIFNYLTNNTIPEGATTSHKLILKKRARSYCVKGGILYYGHTKPKKVITDKEEQLNILQDTHVENGTGIHLGVKKMYSAVSGFCFWRGQYMDVANYVRQCSKCTEAGESRLSVLQEEYSQEVGDQGEAANELLPDKASGVWEKVEVNVHGPYSKTVNHNEFLVTVIDPVSHWIVAQPISGGNIPSQLASFVYNAFCLFGFAKCLMGKLTEELVEAVRDMYQQQEGSLQHVLTMLGLHCDTIIKNSVFVLNEEEEQCAWVNSLMETFVTSHQDTWDMELHKFVFELNTTTRGTAQTPFFKMFGRKPFSYTQENKENADANVQAKESDMDITSRRRRLQSSILQCRHCEEIFTSKISFRIHQRKHTEEARKRGILEGEEPIKIVGNRERRLLKRPLLKRKQRFIRQHGSKRRRMFQASGWVQNKAADTEDRLHSASEVLTCPASTIGTEKRRSVRVGSPSKDANRSNTSRTRTELATDICNLRQSEFTSQDSTVPNVSSDRSGLLVDDFTVSYRPSQVILPNQTLSISKDNSELMVDTHTMSSVPPQSMFISNDIVSTDISKDISCDPSQLKFSNLAPSISKGSPVQIMNAHTVSHGSPHPMFINNYTVSSDALKDVSRDTLQSPFSSLPPPLSNSSPEPILDGHTVSNDSEQPMFESHNLTTGHPLNDIPLQPMFTSQSLTSPRNTPELIEDAQAESNDTSQPINISHDTTPSGASNGVSQPVFAVKDELELIVDARGCSHHMYVGHEATLPDTFNDSCTVSCEPTHPTLSSQTLSNIGSEVIVDTFVGSSDYMYINHDTTPPGVSKDRTDLELTTTDMEYSVSRPGPHLGHINIVVYSTDDLNVAEPSTGLKSSQFNEDSKSGDAKPRFQAEGAFTCDYCGSDFDYKTRLIAHMEKKHTNTLLRCSKCTYATKCKQLLEYHQAIHNGSFKCKVCGKLFTRKIYLKYHLASQHSSSRVYHICTLCGAKFMSMTGCRRHIQTKHEPSKEYACNLCSYVGNCSNSLTSHMIRLHNKQFQCSSCDYRSTSEGGLNRHMRIVHSVEERQFPCRHCSYRGAKRRQLLEHEKNMHSPDISRHKCPICNKLFKTQVLMKHHLLCHTNRHLYSCKGCDYTTRHRQTLHYHIKRTHPGQDVKDLSIGPSEADFQDIISAATQELLPVEQDQQDEEDYTAVTCEVIHSAEMILASDYLPESYELLHPQSAICDLNPTEEPVSEPCENVATDSDFHTSIETDQAVTIMDGSDLTSDEVHKMVALANDMSVGKHEMHQLVTLSDKETVQTFTPLSNVDYLDSETHQVVTYIEDLESVRNDSHQHIVTLLNTPGLEPSKENTTPHSMNHINLIDSSEPSQGNVVIVPLGYTNVAIIHQNPVIANEDQEGPSNLVLAQKTPVLDLVPQHNTKVEPQYEEVVSSWNQVSVYHLDS